MNIARFLFSTVLYIILSIQAVSHSQYYPHAFQTGDRYDFSDERIGHRYPASLISSENYFETRNFHPHLYYEPVAEATSVQYFGTSKTVSTSSDSDNQEKLTEPSASLASYRIRYNNPGPPDDSQDQDYPPVNYFDYPPQPPPPIYSPPEPPPPRPQVAPSPPPPAFSSSRGIGVSLDDEGQMNIYLREPGRPQVFQFKPQDSRNQGPPPVSRPRTDTGVEFGARRAEDGNDRGRPPYAFVVVIDNRPEAQCFNESYRMYRKDGRCYEIRHNPEVSPCGRLMKYYPEEENQVYGDCDCLIDNGYVSRPLAYWKPHERCYLLYQRGPCRYSEWLILDRDGYPQCASRSCPQTFGENEYSQEFWFLYKGKCYKTGEYYSSICSSGQEDGKVYLVSDGPQGPHEPKCLKGPPNLRGVNPRPLLSPVMDLRCKPGYKKMQNGKCKKIWNFDRNDYDYY